MENAVGTVFNFVTRNREKRAKRISELSFFFILLYHILDIFTITFIALLINVQYLYTV